MPPREQKGRRNGAQFGQGHKAQEDAAPLVIVVTPRRFCAQQSSVDSVQIGRSLPYEIVSTRAEDTPRLTRYSFTAFARRAPSARLYSRVPRSSQCPSTVTRTCGYFCNQAACR